MSEHPDLDALSAYLDAESDFGVEEHGVGEHARGCAACRAQVARLRAGRDLVAQPVPAPPDGVRERSIAAALAAAPEWATAPAPAVGVSGAGSRPPSPSPATVVPRGRGRGRSRWWVAASGVAAAVALVVGAVGLLGQKGGDESTGTALSAGPPAAESGTGAGAAAADSGAPAKAGLTTVELGDVADINALRARLAASAPLAASAAPEGQASSRSSAGANSAAGAVNSVTGAAGDAPSGMPAPVPVGARVCEEQARIARPALGATVYAANLRFAGTPAVALGFATKASDPPATVLVLAPEQGCRLLAETSLP